MRERINLRPTILLVVVAALTAGGIVLLQRWQVNRHAQGLLEIARSAEAKGRFDRVGWLLATYLEMVPGDTPQRVWYGETLEKLARDARSRGAAAVAYEMALNEDPSLADVRKRLARIYVRDKRLAEAENHLTILGAEKAADAELAFLLALCERVSGKRSEAIINASRALKLDPSQVGWYYQLALLLRPKPGSESKEWSKDDRKAMEDAAANHDGLKVKNNDELIDKMVEANPGSATAYLYRVQYRHNFKKGDLVAGNKAQAASEREKLNEAINRDIEKALALAPTDLEVRLMAEGVAMAAMSDALAAEDLYEAEEYAEAARGHLRAALEHHPSDERVYLQLALLEIKDGDAKEAAAQLRKGIARLPGRSALLFSLAGLMLDLHDLDEAKRVLAEISRWKLAPEQALVLRARMLMAAGEWKAAKDILEEGRSSLTTASASLALSADLLIGQCYEQLGEDDLALAAYRRAADVQMDGAAAPADPALRAEASVRVARTLQGTGRLAEAIEQYRQLASAPTASLEVRIMSARLQTVQYLRRKPGSRDPAELTAAFARIAEKNPDALDLLLLRVEVLAADRETIPEAEQLVREALRNKPDSAELSMTLARILFRIGNKSAAWNIEALRPQPATAELSPSLVRLFFKGGPRDEAWDILNAVEAKSGKSVESVLTRLEMIPNDSDPRASAAFSNGEQLFLRNPPLPPEDRVRLAIGLAQIQAGWRKFSEASRWWQEVAKLRPHDLSVQIRNFDMAVQEENPNRMIETVREIHGIEGTMGAFGHYAEAMLLLSNPKDRTPEGLREARSHLEAAAKLRPMWANLQTCLALIDDYQGRKKEALAGYQRAIELGEQRTTIIRRAVQLLCDSRRYPEADRLLQKLRPDGYLSTALNKLAAEVSRLNQQPQRAAELAAVAVGPDSPYLEHLWQAEILAYAEKNDEALAAFRRAIELAGEHGAPWVALVRYHVRAARNSKLTDAERADHLAKAETAIAEVRRQLKGSELPLTLAQCKEAVGQLAEAEEAYQKAVKEWPDDMVALQQLVGFYDRMASSAKAIPALKAALSRPIKPADAIWIRLAEAIALAMQGSPPAFSEALALADQNIAAEPNNLDHLVTKARILATRPQRRREALQIMLQVQQQRRLEPPEEFLLGKLYTDTGAGTDGRRVLYDLCTRDDENPAYLPFIINYLLGIGENAEAEILLRKYERFAPDAYDTLRLKCVCLARRSDFPEAMAAISRWAHFDAASSEKPLPEPDRYRLGYAAALADQLCGESAAAETALAPFAERLYRRLTHDGSRKAAWKDELPFAAFLGRHGNVAEALPLARKTEPEAGSLAVASALISMAFAPKLQSEANLNAIELELNASLSRAKPSPIRDQLAGNMLARRGRYAEAAEAFRRAAQQNADDAELLNNIAYMLLLANAPRDQVAAMLAQAEAKAGRTASILDTRGMLFLARNQAAEAIAAFEEAKVQENSAVRCLHLAMAYQLAGRGEDAANLIKRIHPDSARFRPLDSDGSLVFPAEQQQYQKLKRELQIKP